MKYRFEIVVSLKDGLLDPQGKAVEGSLPTAGFDDVSQVRVGKLVALSVDAEDPVAALAVVERIAEQVLSNPVIEDYRILEASGVLQDQS